MRTLVAGARLGLGAHDLLSGGNSPWKRWSTCAERSWRLHRRTGLTMSQNGSGGSRVSAPAADGKSRAAAWAASTGFSGPVPLPFAPADRAPEAGRTGAERECGRAVPGRRRERPRKAAHVS
jgi:hypothetical protein